MLRNILETSTENGSGWGSWLIIGLFVVVIVVFMVLNNRSQKKRQKETQDLIDAIQPGNKVKTIGGICGIVVEVCPEDNTFVLETGTEASGKCFIKFDKQAVYQTDAVVKKEEVKEETKEEAKEVAEGKTVEETPVEETPVEEVPVVEAPAEEKAEPVAEKPKKKSKKSE